VIRKHALAVIALVLAVSLPALAGDASQGVVNINTATAEQLQLLPRVGPALADRIIEFRQSNGPFGSVAELVAVKGIGERSLAKLEPFVTTQGATTLNDKVKLPRTTNAGDGA
jgi:competence protein ComEA